jgi:hypothetical protein
MQKQTRHCASAPAADHSLMINCISHLCLQDVNLDGPVPRQFCWISSVREFDLDGGQLTGPFPRCVWCVCEWSGRGAASRDMMDCMRHGVEAPCASHSNAADFLSP